MKGSTRLRRVLVISPEYLKSKHCLWELCSCLAWSSTNLLVILKDLPSGALLEQRLYPSINQECTLAEALAVVYQSNEIRTMPVEFRSGPLGANDFENKINDLKGRIYYSSNEPVQTLCKAISDHTVTAIPESELVKEFHDYCGKLFEQWRQQAFASECLHHLNDFNLEDLTQPNHIKIRDLINIVKDRFKKSEQINEDKIKAIKDLSGLLAFKLIDPVWATEMRMSSLNGLRIRLAVNPDDPTYSECFSCQMAAHAIQRVQLELEPRKDSDLPDITNHLRLTPISYAREEQENDASYEARCRKQRTHHYLKELVMRRYQWSAEKAEAYMKQKNWQSEFRADAFMNNSINEENVFTSVRFYIGQAGNDFGSSGHERWDTLIDDLIRELNQGAEQDETITIGVLIVSNRDDGNMLQFFGSPQKRSQLVLGIKTLMELCINE